MAALLNEPVAIEDVYSEVLECWETEPASSLVDRTLEFYTRFYLQDDVLLKVDRASMMNSLETRAVFLDNDIVEFCRLEGIMVQGRVGGAAWGVCQSMGSRPMYPVGMELLFERFLSEERGEWPAIELDLPSGVRRERVIQHV